MSPVTWSDKLSVGIDQVDDEHKKLVAIFNELDEAAQSGRGTRVMADILNRLIEYTQIHFAAEEALMSEAEYPELNLHLAQHRQLVRKVVALRSKFTGSGRRITKEMIDFLKYWLTNHIQQDDMRFGAFCQAGTTLADEPVTADSC